MVIIKRFHERSHVMQNSKQIISIQHYKTKVTLYRTVRYNNGKTQLKKQQ